MRGLGAQRRYSAGSYPAAARGDENAPPRGGFGAAPSTSGPMGPGAAASGLPFHPRAIRPSLASASSSMYNRKPQLPAPTAKKVSGVRTVGKTPVRQNVARTSLELKTKPGSGVTAAGNTPAQLSVARTSLDLTKKPSLSLVTRSLDLPSFKVKDSISFWEGEVNHRSYSSKSALATPANLEACSDPLKQYMHMHDFEKKEAYSDEGFMRNTESKLSLELEWDILKTILVEEYKSHADVEGRAAALDDELKAANFRILEACRQKEAIQAEPNDTREALESNLLDSIQESNELKKANEKSLELLKERDMEIHRLNMELEKARIYQQDHVSRQVEVQTELITNLATEQSAIQIQLEASKNNELLAKQNLGEIELLFAIETIVQKVVLAQNYASLLESQREQLKSYYDGRLKELEIRMQEMNDQDAASLISMNKEVDEQLEGEMAQQHLSHEEYQLESSQFEHPSPNEQPEFYSNGTDSDQAPLESESGEQETAEAVKPIIQVVEEKELPPVAPVQERKPLDYALAPSDELKKLRAINHYEGQRTATDRRFWSIEQ